MRRWMPYRRPICVPKRRGSTGKLNLPGRPHSLPGWLLYSVAVLLLRGRLPPSFGHQLLLCSKVSLLMAWFRARSIRAETSLGIPVAAEAPIDDRAVLEGKQGDSAHNCRAVPRWTVPHVCLVPSQAPRQSERVVSNGVFEVRSQKAV